jgi:exodeoxyribonuclease-3
MPTSSACRNSRPRPPTSPRDARARGHAGLVPRTPRRRATAASASTAGTRRTASSKAWASPTIDAEGRFLQLDFGKLSVVSLYLPSGSSSEERQQVKFDFMDRFLPHMDQLYQSGQEVVVCGDWNIAHREADLKNWKSNQKNSGFLPEERAWLSRLFDEQGWIDVYRRLHPEATDDCYTWWSNRGQAWAKNVGWRLDYQVATPGLATQRAPAEVYKEQRFSDHAPLTVDYDWTL